MVNSPKPSGLLPPVLVLSTGRCGSTMISDILNLHPHVLSLSELFSFTGLTSFAKNRRSGDWMWSYLSKPRSHTRLMLRGDFSELLYPFDIPGARFTRADVPPIMCAVLPHLTADHDALYDELEPVIRALPTQNPAEQYRRIFGWLCRKFGNVVWAERSGASLLSASVLLRHFPEARVVHVYRDGRDVALSMSRHYLFRMIVASLMTLRLGPLDPLQLLQHDRLWEQVMTRLTPAMSGFALKRRLPYERLDLTHFGAFWSRMIEQADRVLGQQPSDRVLNVKFEDVQVDPEGQIRRLIRFISTDLEDADWVRMASSIPRPTKSRFPELTVGEQRSLTESCRPGLELLGYCAQPDVDNRVTRTLAGV